MVQINFVRVDRPPSPPPEAAVDFVWIIMAKEKSSSMLDSDHIQAGSDSDDFVPRCKANIESKSAPGKVHQCTTTGDSVVQGFCGYHSKFRKPVRVAAKRAKLAIENNLSQQALLRHSSKSKGKENYLITKLIRRLSNRVKTLYNFPKIVNGLLPHQKLFLFSPQLFQILWHRRRMNLLWLGHLSFKRKSTFLL